MRIGGWLLLGSLAWANLVRVRSLGMDTRPPSWVVDAIPPALSNLVYHLKADYTSYRAVSEAFYISLAAHHNDPGPYANAVNGAILYTSSLHLEPSAHDTLLLGNDDKGIVDLVKLAFVVFGRDSARIIDAYFGILFLSITVFVARFGRDFLPFVITALFLAGHYSILPLAYYNAELQSVLALRFLPVLSLIACLHCVWFACRPDRSWAGSICLVLQTIIVVFTVHLRSVTLWQLAVIFAGPLMFGWRAWRQREPQRGGLLRLLPALLALVGLVALGQYRQLAYSAEYRTSKVMATRNFWHNILSGFAFHPALAYQYRLKVDDASELRAVGRYLTQNGRDADWAAIGGAELNNSWSRRWVYSRLKFIAYEQGARNFVCTLLRQHPAESFATLAYYKPKALLRDLLWVYGLRPQVPDAEIFVSPDIGDIVAVRLHRLQSDLDRRHLRFILWNRVNLLTTLLLTLLWSARPNLLPLAEWRPFACLVVGSLLPTLIGYPAMWTIAEPILLMALVTGTLVAWMGARLFSACAQRPEGMTSPP